MAYKDEAFESVKWLFEKLLNQRGNAKWIENDLERCAELMITLSDGFNDMYEYHEEVVHYYVMHVNKRADKKLKAQKRRHDYRHNFQTKDWLETVSYFDYRCAYCREDGKLTVDHFVPFSKGGELVKGNIISVCARCNSSKSNHDFSEWYEKQPFFNEDSKKKILNFIY